VLTYIVNSQYVGMVQRGYRSRFLLEAVQAILVTGE
jgi:hypothetical protein